MEPRIDENRKKALAAALGQIEKQFGKGSVMRLGDAAAIYDVEAVSDRFARARYRARRSVACRAAAWSRSMARNPPARPR